MKRWRVEDGWGSRTTLCGPHGGSMSHTFVKTHGMGSTKSAP